MKYIIISLIYFSIFNIIICLNCDPRRNCLRANGYCINDICNCYPGFITYQIHKTKEIKYCTYEQTPKWIPLLLLQRKAVFKVLFLKKKLLILYLRL